MALETAKERVIYQGIVPIIAAIIGAFAATWFQSFTVDQAQIADVVSLLKDPELKPDQKLQALKLYEQITDRPWSIIRSLTTTLTVAITMALGAMVAGGFFNKNR